MRVGLDGTPLTITSGGLRRYVSALSEALAEEFPEDSYSLISQPASPQTTAEKRWWLLGLPEHLRRNKIDVFHGTNFEVPYLGRTPAVLTILDLSPWKDPAWHHAADRVRRRTPWLVRLGRARRIITLSYAVRQEIVDFFQVPAQRVHAIPLAAGGEFHPVDAAPVHTKPFFLFTGTLEPRKNIPGLIEAWQAAQTGLDLILIGRKRADAPALPDLPGLYLAGELIDTELIAYYSQATAFVYPTLYEGFGLPVLEAMQCGCPVLTSNDPAVREVSGGAALHSGTVSELSAQMQRVASEPALRLKLRENGLARAREFSWQHTARMTREVYRETITH